ncbi:hypothetical protein FQA39_LY10970 [Lamprigera yunnana]|nr:hypothetical protein FQA39_LY10970 [Lamprigera yunnana]
MLKGVKYTIEQLMDNEAQQIRNKDGMKLCDVDTDVIKVQYNTKSSQKIQTAKKTTKTGQPVKKLVKQYNKRDTTGDERNEKG